MFPDAADRVLAEHQIGAVGEREGLLVLALHRGLHRRRQRRFQRIDQRDERQFVELRLQLHPHLSGATVREAVLQAVGGEFVHDQSAGDGLVDLEPERVDIDFQVDQARRRQL